MDSIPMGMLELVKLCIPKITKDKVFKELAVETNQENVVVQDLKALGSVRDLMQPK